MTKRDLICKITELLRENDIKKPISAQKTTLHISDDYGNHSNFIIKKTGRRALYTVDDVAAILDAAMAVVEDSIRRGEEVSVHGFGTLGVHYRAPRSTKHPDTGEPVKIVGRYVPKFRVGKSLKQAAMVYDLTTKESGEESGVVQGE